MAIKNIKSNVSTHVTKKTKSNVTAVKTTIEKGSKKMMSDEINDMLASTDNIKKSIDPESLDFFGDSAKVTATEDFGDIEDDNRGTRLRGDIQSEFTTGKYSGKKSSRKDNNMEEEDDEDEIDKDNDYDIYDENIDDEEESDKRRQELEEAFDFQDEDESGSDDDDDGEIVVSSNIDKADMIFKKLQQQEKEEESQPKLVTSNENDEMEKAQNTKNQTALYNEFLTTRILLQRTINCANKLPKPKVYKEFLELKDKSLNNKVEDVKKVACQLVSEVYNLQSELMELNDEIPKSSQKKRIRPEQSLTEIWNIIEEQNQRLDQFHNATITKWNNRINVTGGSISSSGKNNSSSNLKSLNQSILSQISNTLNDFERLQKRTKLKRTTYRIIGDKDTNVNSKQNAVITIGSDQNEEEKDEYDDEIFDDTDFYQNLLKDLENNNDDDNEVGSQYWIEMRNLKKKKKKKVNQKASKGRILRYEVFPKLENFMTPQPVPIPDWNIDQLYQNLFSGLGNVNSIKLD